MKQKHPNPQIAKLKAKRRRKKSMFKKILNFVRSRNNGLKLKGEWVFERRRKDGTVIDREVVKNLIVNTGKEKVAKLIGGTETGIAGFTHIAIGLSGTGDTVGATDTELTSEVERAAATAYYQADYKCIFEHTFTFGTAESYGIEEAGVFDGATPTGSIMLNRVISATKNVDADTDLFVKITITVA